MERRLSAILAADVVDYSRLMGRDEEGTLTSLKEVRANVVDPAIAERRGTLYNLAYFYALAGEKGPALDCLEKAASVGRVSREWVEHDSDLDPIRDEPRYLALLETL